MNFYRLLTRLIVCAAVLLPAGFAQAELKLPSLFNDHMVLQQAKPVHVWGWTDAEAMVTVTVGEQSAKVKADGEGNFSAKLPARKASKDPIAITVTNDKGDSQAISDVLVGEVWVCSGQSNMEWSVKHGIDDGAKHKSEAKHPTIRLFYVPKKVSGEPQQDVNASWTLCTPQTMEGFSAVGYFFGRHLKENLDVPIGLINSNWGGTECEPWTSPEGLKQEAVLKPHLEMWKQNLERDANLQGNPQRPAGLFNGMIAPLTKFPIRGAIWYQGESNVPRAYDYRYVFPNMIRSWRQAWGDEQMPFYFVQIAPWKYEAGFRVKPLACAVLWEGQSVAAKTLEHTGMVVISDIGNLDDIHPRNKLDVGKRLGNYALAQTYDKSGIPFSGPFFKSASFSGAKAVVTFDHADVLKTRDGKEPTNFQIAGQDQVFHPAEAVIQGNKVVVQSSAVAKPVAVRFAFHELATPNLMNGAGLPAVPFRTDEWEVPIR